MAAHCPTYRGRDRACCRTRRGTRRTAHHAKHCPLESVLRWCARGVLVCLLVLLLACAAGFLRGWVQLACRITSISTMRSPNSPNLHLYVCRLRMLLICAACCAPHMQSFLDAALRASRKLGVRMCALMLACGAHMRVQGSALQPPLALIAVFCRCSAPHQGTP